MVYNLSGANVSEISFKGEAFSLLPTDDFVYIASLDKITRCFSYGDATVAVKFHKVVHRIEGKLGLYTEMGDDIMGDKAAVFLCEKHRTFHGGKVGKIVLFLHKR